MFARKLKYILGRIRQVYTNFHIAILLATSGILVVISKVSACSTTYDIIYHTRKVVCYYKI